jgi:hypothetical protein
VLAEGMARNVRRYLNVVKLKPMQAEHEARQGATARKPEAAGARK